MPMLTRLAIGALVIQTATLDPQCVESCTLALWIKTCPADCDDSTWQSINIGPVVIPPDTHCVSGSLIGNILHLVLTDGSTIDVDLSPLATDNNTFLTTLALAGTVLTATLNSGATVTVDLAPLIPVDVKLSALALAGTVLTATLTDGSTVTVDLAPLIPVVDLCAELNTLDTATDAFVPATADVSYVRADGSCGRAPIAAPQRVSGISPFVINPTTGNANWGNGATESTPIATLTVTNPSATKPLYGTLYAFHGLYVRMANPLNENPKNSTLSATGLLNVDNGGGVLQNPVSFYPLFNGNPQIIAQGVRHDAGAMPASAGNQTQHLNHLPITIPPGATVTFRSQSSFTVQDGDSQGTIWTYNRISFDGMVY